MFENDAARDVFRGQIDDIVVGVIEKFAKSCEQAYALADAAGVRIRVKEPTLELVHGNVYAFTWGFEVLGDS